MKRSPSIRLRRARTISGISRNRGKEKQAAPSEVDIPAEAGNLLREVNFSFGRVEYIPSVGEVHISYTTTMVFKEDDLKCSVGDIRQIADDPSVMKRASTITRRAIGALLTKLFC